MEILEVNQQSEIPASNKKGALIAEENLNSNTKTKRLGPTWFTSSAYKEKIGIYSRFSEFFTQIIHELHQVFNEIYLKTKENDENLPNISNEKEIIKRSKNLIKTIFYQINEVIGVYDLGKPVLLQDVTGLNYKLISKLTSIVQELEDFIGKQQKNNENKIKTEEHKVIKNWFLVYSHLFHEFTNEINFNLRLLDHNTNISYKLRKSKQLSNVLTMLIEEISDIFLKKNGQNLIILIDNYKIQEINDLENINERLGIEKIKASSPLSLFENFVFVLNPKTLTQIKNNEDKEFICNVANKFKKVSVLRFSEISKNETKRRNIPIEKPNYFNDKCLFKYLHFFKPFSKFLLLFDLSLIQKNINIDNGNYIKIPLNINFNIAYDYKSLITPEGEIFLSAGKLNEKGLFYPDDSFHLLDYANETLTEISPMPIAKKLHGMTYLKRNIFIIGGKTFERKCTAECEKYDITLKKWKKISGLNEPVIYPSVTTFGDK